MINRLMFFITLCPSTWWNYLYLNTSSVTICHRNWLQLRYVCLSSEFCTFACISMYSNIFWGVIQNSWWSRNSHRYFMERHITVLFRVYLPITWTSSGEILFTGYQVGNEQISGDFLNLNLYYRICKSDSLKSTFIVYIISHCRPSARSTSYRSFTTSALFRTSNLHTHTPSWQKWH